MKRKRIETAQDMLIILLNHFMMVSLGVTAMGILDQDCHKIWLWSLLLGIPVLFYWAEIKIQNPLRFYAIHLAVPAVLIVLPMSVVSKIPAIFMSIIYVVWSLKIGIKPRRRGEGVVGPVYMTAALGIMSLVETFSSQKGWIGIYIAMAILYAAVYCVYLYVSQYLEFVIANENSAANIPEAGIFKQGFRHSVTYISGMVIFLAIFSNVGWFARMDSWIVSRCWDMVTKIFQSLFSGEDKVKEGMAVALPKQPPTDLELFLESVGPSGPGLNMEKPLIVGGFLILAGLLVLGIVKAIPYLWRGIRRTTVTEEENDSIDIRESCTIEKNKKEGSTWFAFLNHREKIRKLYRKQVLKNRTAIIGDLVVENLKHMTAKECCDKFSAEQLRKIYEKARYSEEEITSHDVRAAKSSRR